MSKFLFLVNPIAGGGKALSFIQDIETEMGKAGYSFKLFITSRPGEATELVESNADFDICVAVGGDGTVNEVAIGILNRGWGTLGIIPGGTGNDLGKSLGIEEGHQKALTVVLTGREREIDLGSVDGRYFFNIASLGFDSEVVRHTNRIKRVIKGKASYILGVLTTLLVYKKKRIFVDIDGVKIERNATLVAVGNGMYYGGGMQILPMARIDDQLLDVCIVKDISNFRILTLFPTIFKGEHTKYTKYVEFHTGSRIGVRVEGESLLNIDGELYDIDDEEVIFNLAKEKLKVLW